MRVAAEHVVVAGGLHPGDVLLRRENMVPFPLVVHVGDRAVGPDPPAQHPDVGDRGTGLEHGEQQAFHAPQLQEPRVSEVPVHFRKIAAESGVVYEARQVAGRCRDEGRRAVTGREAVQGEHVGDAGLRP